MASCGGGSGSETYSAATALGPAEPWFCACRDRSNLTILRPPSCERCPRCGEFAPWARPDEPYVDPGNFRSWPRGYTANGKPPARDGCRTCHRPWEECEC